MVKVSLRDDIISPRARNRVNCNSIISIAVRQYHHCSVRRQRFLPAFSAEKALALKNYFRA